MKKAFVPVEKIQTKGLQMRAKLDMDIVRDYAEAEREAAVVFPPVVVFLDKAGVYWLADGFHRLGAYRQNGKTKIACEVHDGEYVDALRYALGANIAHGLRRSNADKAQAVRVAYANRKALGLPDVPAANLIAELVGVHHSFASAQLATVASWKAATERTGSDGKTRSVPPPPTRRRSEPVDDVEVIDEVHRPSSPPPVRATAGSPPPPPMRDSLPPVRPEKAKPSMNLPKDARGVDVPPGLSELWSRRVEVQEMAECISKVRVALRKAQEGKDPLWAGTNFSNVLAHLDQIYKEITACEPWAVCPSCQGIGCRFCKDQGLISKFRFDTVIPREFK